MFRECVVEMCSQSKKELERMLRSIKVEVKEEVVGNLIDVQLMDADPDFPRRSLGKARSGNSEDAILAAVIEALANDHNDFQERLAPALGMEPVIK